MTNTQPYTTKELRATLAGLPKHIDLRLDLADVRFLSNFVKDTAFYVEEFEQYLGEELIDFWQTREHALRIVTDWMLQSFAFAQS